MSNFKLSLVVRKVKNPVRALFVQAQVVGLARPGSIQLIFTWPSALSIFRAKQE